MKLALVSPLPPDRSGIADFSAMLAEELKAGAGITVDAYTQDKFTAWEYDEHDVTLYQMGNNATFHGKMYGLLQELPGIVEIHDLTLHNMVAGMYVPDNRRDEYIAEYEYVYGAWGSEVGQLDWDHRLQLWESRPNKFPMLARVLDCALAVIVHSRTAAAIVKQYSATVPCFVIPLLTRDIPARRASSVPGRSIRISSFGQVQRNKQMPEVLAALGRLARTYSFFFTVVGSSTNDRNALLSLASHYGIRDRVEFIGRVSRDVLLDSIASTDISVNLRQPTFGETSAALLDCFSVGTAAIVTDDGWYAELPDHVCLKVDPSASNLVTKLKSLMAREALRRELTANSREWVRVHHGPVEILPKYVEVLSGSPNSHRITSARYGRYFVRRLQLPPHPLTVRSLHEAIDK